MLIGLAERAVVALVAMLLLGASVQEPAAASSRGPALAAVLDEVRAELDAPGAILGVRTSTGETITVAAGVADLETRRPMRSDDAYFLGSISKTYTASVVLRLQEEGLLTLDDPLARFLADFPRAAPGRSRCASCCAIPAG